MRLPVLIALACTLAAAEPSLAGFSWRPGRDLTARRQLAEAQRMHAARDPRGAILIYRSLVSDAPGAVAISAPALSGLIACHQMLAGDPASDADYRSWVGRYLAKPPPLDGTTVPRPEDLREELLWHPLLRAVPPLAWTASTSEAWIDGRRSTSISLLAEVRDLPDLARIASGQPAPIATVTIGKDLETLPATPLFRPGLLSLEIRQPPRAGRIDRIQTTLRLELPLAVEETDLALTPGAVWSSKDSTTTVGPVELADEELSVTLLIRLGGSAPLDEADPPNQASMAGMPMAQMADGSMAAPVHAQMNQNNRRRRAELVYHVAKGAKPVALTFVTVSSWSVRDLVIDTGPISLP